MSDHLWDKEGEPDSDVAYLERALAPLRHVPRPLPSLPARAPRRRRWLPAVAATAALAAAAIVLVVTRPWQPRWIDTRTAVTVRIGDIGTVELAAGARARLVAAEKIALERGSLTARIAAPPRRFAVVTPHATVTDLGCVFTVAVDDAGDARVEVREGRVAVANEAAPEVVVPAGAKYPAEAVAPPAPMPATPPATAPPAPAVPKVVAPSPVAPHATPAPAHATKRAASAKKAPAHVAPAIKATAPKKATTPPARKAEPQPHLSHDPLKDLERSVE